MNNRAIAALLAAIMSCAAARAQGLPAFGYVGAASLRDVKTPVPPSRFAVSAKAGDVITDYHMLIQAGRDVLFGYAQTDEQFRQAAAYWTAALKAAGVKAGEATLADGMFKIPYRSPDGRVLRDFLADSRQFPPKDEAGLRANMALASDALKAAGRDVVAARVVNVDSLLPTYSLLYWTRPDENPDHETRLRVLKPGDDIDFGVYRGTGVTVVQTPQTWMMVYLGPAVGYVSLISQTPEGLQKKVAERLDFLKQNGRRIIATRDFSVDDADYKYGAGVYFFQ